MEINYIKKYSAPENLEIRVYEMKLGFAVNLWDLDCDLSVGITIFPTSEKALSFAKETLEKM